MIPKASRSISAHRSDFACLHVGAADSAFLDNEPSIACCILRVLSCISVLFSLAGGDQRNPPFRFDLILFNAASGVQRGRSCDLIIIAGLQLCDDDSSVMVSDLRIYSGTGSQYLPGK